MFFKPMLLISFCGCQDEGSAHTVSDAYVWGRGKNKGGKGTKEKEGRGGGRGVALIQPRTKVDTNMCR